MQHATSPSVLELASHTNPYPYYAALQAQPLQFDEDLGMWIASSAALLQEIFASSDCIVRPAAEPIPKALVGTGSGEVFQYLIRMNEGSHHQVGKQLLQSSLRSLNWHNYEAKFQQVLDQLAQASPLQDGAQLSSWMMKFPVSAVAIILGFHSSELNQVQQCMNDFVRCLSPLSSSKQIAAASLAAQTLQQRFTSLLKNAQTEPQSFLAQLQTEAEGFDWQHALVANLIGLLSQTYEATAGLIGNCLIAFQQHPQLRQQLQNDTAEIASFVEEVARYDAPIQNTRRFVVNDCTIAGQTLKAGDSILLLIAAANRDALVYPQPNELQLHRNPRPMFSFSHARHACPGQALALQLCACAVQFVLSRSTDTQWHALHWQYQASQNARIPVFNHALDRALINSELESL
jgi:cytochrome P450